MLAALIGSVLGLAISCLQGLALGSEFSPVDEPSQWNVTSLILQIRSRPQLRCSLRMYNDVMFLPRVNPSAWTICLLIYLDVAFLQATAAAQDAARMGPPEPDPRSIEMQPKVIVDLWERFTDFTSVLPADSRSHCRVESWFLHHSLSTGGHVSRITLLTADC